ncbi:MAG: hypothetical protein RIS52_2338, partial [Pseudomonadota bacterium]
MCTPEHEDWPQAGRTRLIRPAPVGEVGTDHRFDEMAMMQKFNETTVAMMGDNPALPRMPTRPKLLDFFKLRFTDVTVRHLLASAKRALDDGQEEKIILACLLHDISNGCLIRT